MISKHYVTWESIDLYVDKIESKIKSKNHKFKALWGIPRGGLVLATMLSHRLDIPLISGNDIPRDRPLLIVDDIADTGKTLERVLNNIRFYPKNRDEITIVTAYYHKQSTVIPDIWIEEKTDKWIVYPWETK